MTSAHTRAQSSGASVARRRPAWMAAARRILSSSETFGAFVALLADGDVANHGHEGRAHGADDGCGAAAPRSRIAAGEVVQKFLNGRLCNRHCSLGSPQPTIDLATA